MSEFKRFIQNGIVYYKAENLENLGFLEHIYTTRLGGVSEGECESLNLGINKNDKKENVYENFRRVAEILGGERDNIFVLNQVHENTVHILSGSDESPFYDMEKRISADGIVTREKGRIFGVFTADCVGIILADKKTKTAAAVHSGWRSTAMHIVCEAVKKMQEVGSSPEDIYVAIGPHIRDCCFEVKEDAYLSFDEKYRIIRDNKVFIDLSRVIKDDLISVGVLEENISESPICTCCENHEFFSSRAQKGKMGLSGAFVRIKK